MKKFIDFLENFQGFLAVIIFIGLTAVVFLQVVTRYVFHAPFLWSEEVARFLFFWVALVGASMSVKNGRHFVIEVITVEKIGNRTLRKILQLIPSLSILLFALLMAIVGYEYFIVGGLRVGVNSRINMRFVYAAIPFAGVSMIIYSCYHIVHILKGGQSEKKAL